MPKKYLALTLILLLGAVSRIFNIDNFSLWVDEGLAWYHANSPDLVLSLARDTHPPLYFASLRIWEVLAGQSEVALRMFSVLPSMLSIAMMVPLAKELVRARGGLPRLSAVPILAALMLALADAEIFMSQEVRHYTWHVLFAICSMWAFLRWLRLQKRQHLILWIAFTTLLVYTHYIGAFTGIVQGLYALFFLRGRVRVQAIGALIVSAVMLAPWLLIVGVQQVDNNGINWGFEAGWYMIENIKVQWFSQQWPLMLGLAVFGTITVVYAPRFEGAIERTSPSTPLHTWREENGWQVKLRPLAPTLLMVLWVVVPIGLTFLLNNFIPILSTRRMTQITPAVALLFAFGLSNIRQPARGFLVAVIIVYSVLYVDFSRFEPDWRDVARMTTDYAVPGDLVLSDVGGGDYQLLYYYDQYLLDDVTVRSLKVWRDFEPETFGQVGAFIEPYNSVWLMYWSDDGQIFGWLNQLGFVQTSVQRLEHLGSILEVQRFDRLPEGQIVTYDNGMTLRNIAVYPDQLRVDLWWSVEQPPSGDYTTSVFLLDANSQLVAQYDSAPFNGNRLTTTWQGGDIVYDPKSLVVASGGQLPPGQYTIGVQVYAWSPDGTVRSLTSDGQEWAGVGEIEVTNK